MNIKYEREEPKKFSELKIGDVFLVNGNPIGKIFIKILAQKGTINAVSLPDGFGDTISKDEECVVLNAELIIK